MEDDTLFSRMDWPPQSPELNSSEELCNVLEKALDNGLTRPAAIEDLGEKLMQLWTEMKVVILHKVEKKLRVKCLLKCIYTDREGSVVCTWPVM